MTRSHNRDLPALPDDLSVMRVVNFLYETDREGHRLEIGVTAQRIAWQLDVRGARRLGNGAVKGTWSGRMAPALRLAPRLESFRRRGLLGFFYDDYSRRAWYLTKDGKAWLAEAEIAHIPTPEVL